MMHRSLSWSQWPARPLSATGTLSATVAKSAVSPGIRCAGRSRWRARRHRRRAIRPHHRTRYAIAPARSNFPRGRFAAGAKQIRVDASFAHSPGRFDTGHCGFRSRPTPCRSSRFTFSKLRGPARRVPSRCAHAGPSISFLRKTGAPDSAFGICTPKSLAKTAVGWWRVGQRASHRGDRRQCVAGAPGIGFRRLVDRRRRPVAPGRRTTPAAPPSVSPRWIWPSCARGWRHAGSLAGLAGSAEGSLRLDGPALHPRAMTAELRITRSKSRPPLPPVSHPPLLRSATPGISWSPWPARQSRSSAARLTGHNTDFSVTGSVSLEPEEPARSARGRPHRPRLRARPGTATSTASGSLTADATVRGTLDAPQITGRAGIPAGRLQHRRRAQRHFQRERRHRCSAATAPPSRASAAKPAAARSSSPASPHTAAAAHCLSPARQRASRCACAIPKASARWPTPT